jgi:hypothetical protein
MNFIHIVIFTKGKLLSMRFFITKVTLLTVFLFTFMGCSSDLGNEIIYTMSQPNCSTSKNQVEKDMCEEEAKKSISYEQYKKERKEIINGTK